MLRSLKEIEGYILRSDDGDIGHCKDFLFDDHKWTIRYMVADTGIWLPGRKVLISPISLGEPDWKSRHFPVRLTKERIKNAPALENTDPVSRQHEIDWNKYHGWPHYWMGMHTWGEFTYPAALFDKELNEVPEQKAPELKPEDKHLRSAEAVTGFHIHASDHNIGHVDDFVIEDESWTIRYLVVDTHNWIPGRKVLITPIWIDSIHWSDRQVYIDLTSEQIKDSPEYDDTVPVSREYEDSLFDSHGRQRYWL